MVDGRRLVKATEAGKDPPFAREAFEATPEFANFREGMKRLLQVPKVELDEAVREYAATSPRLGDKNAPGRKRKKRG